MGGQLEQFIKVAASRHWNVSFSGEYHLGQKRHASWPPEIKQTKPLEVRFYKEINAQVPLMTGEDYEIVCMPEGEVALCRGIAIVHPQRVDDSLEEVLYAGLLHCSLIEEMELNIELPSIFAHAVTYRHIELLQDPRTFHDFETFKEIPYPLQINPKNCNSDYALLSRKLTEGVAN